jgi:[acyl-carrier-protein] S-malonyltransferase
VLTLAQAAPLVRCAAAMQDAVPVGTGGMAAVLGWMPKRSRRSAPK